MVKIKIALAPGTEDFLLHLPRSREWEVVSEEYLESGVCELVIASDTWDTPEEVPYPVELALDSHPAVLWYEYER